MTDKPSSQFFSEQTIFTPYNTNLQSTNVSYISGMFPSRLARLVIVCFA